MASSSTGSDIFAAVSLLVICALVLLLLRHYLPLRSTPDYLLIPVFLALVLPCNIILLVPIDLGSIDGGSSRAVWLPEKAVLLAWRITYWLTFLLTWWLLPLLGEYVDSGHRDTRQRIVYSLRQNARYQLIILGVSVAGLVYYIFTNGLNGASIKGMVMALAYAWGLILAIGLMGHGLVALPRRIFRNARPSGRLRALQTQAPKTKDKLDDATDELELLERSVVRLKQQKRGTTRDLQEWIDELADTTPPPDPRPGTAAALGATNVSIPAVVTERYLADLTRKVKRARHKKARFANEWSTLCRQAQHAQAILDAASSKKLDSDRPASAGFFSRLTLLTPSTRYRLHATLLPNLRIALSVFLAIASLMLIWSEVVRSFVPNLSLIGLTVAPSGTVNLAGQIIAAAWLLYMDACALYAISDVRVWGNRALVPRQTYAESACWYSLQVAKLTVPLSYNFITMLTPAVYEGTSFYHFLGQLINLTPLGWGFSRFFPCFLLLPVLATLFNLYGKVKGVFGFGILEDDSDENLSGFGTGGWREGRALIERELLSATGTGTLGLATRGASLDLERSAGVGGRSSTTSGISTTPVTLNTSTSTSTATTNQPASSASASASADVRTANRHFNSITNQEEEPEDDSARHFYQDIAERVRNTLDTVDRPEWMRNLGDGIKMPKWMQREEGQGESALARWFGGRAEGGRVRI